MNQMNIADIYDKAANLIENNGWIQRCYAAEPKFLGLYAKRIDFEEAHDKCMFCVMGALLFSSGLHIWDDETLDLFKPLQYYLNEDSLAGWNDDYITKKKDVISALRETAKKLRDEKEVNHESTT